LTKFDARWSTKMIMLESSEGERGEKYADVGGGKLG